MHGSIDCNVGFDFEFGLAQNGTHALPTSLEQRMIKHRMHDVVPVTLSVGVYDTIVRIEKML
jgi:hypothetical protein